MEKRFKKATAGAICGSKTGLQTVAQGHQLIDFGDDAVLFCVRRYGNQQSPKTGKWDDLLRYARARPTIYQM